MVVDAISRTFTLNRELGSAGLMPRSLLPQAQSVDEVGAAKPNAFLLNSPPSTLLRVCVSLRQRGKAGSGGNQPDDKSSAAADVDVVAGLPQWECSIGSPCFPVPCFRPDVSMLPTSGLPTMHTRSAKLGLVVVSLRVRQTAADSHPDP